MDKPLLPTDILRALGREYRHLAKEHERKRQSGATRRRVGADMARASDRIERLLSHWVSEPDLQAAWRDHLYHGAPEPDGPYFTPPPSFRGLDETGAAILLRPEPDGETLYVGGALLSRGIAPWEVEATTGEEDEVRIGGRVCREVFDASEEAVAALRALRAAPAGAEPPWQYARELFEDGLIDAEFSLTPRGRRRLREPVSPKIELERHHYCVVVADAGDARIYTLDAPDPHEPTMQRLIQVAELSHAEQRAREGEFLSEDRPSVRRGGPSVPRHGVSDRREEHRSESERRFAASVLDEAARIAERYPAGCRMIVAAEPAFLGVLRPLLKRRHQRLRHHDVRELARNLTPFKGPAIHDALADAGMLPPRGRHPLWAPRGSWGDLRE